MVKINCKHNKTKEFKTSVLGHMQGATVIKTWLSSTPTCPDGKDIRGGVGVLRPLSLLLVQFHSRLLCV